MVTLDGSRSVMHQLTDRQRLEELAAQTQLMKPLGLARVQELLKTGRIRLATLAAGCLLHFEGEVCTRLEVIVDGEIRIERIDEQGNLMTIAQCHRNEIIGGNLLFSSNPCYPMTLTATRDTVLLTMGKDILFELLSQNVLFLRAYLELTSDRALVLGSQIRHYVNRPIRACLINYLKQAYDLQKTNPIRLDLSKKMLAEKIGVQRTSISRELAKMRDEGLIRYDKDTVTILDSGLLD